MKAAYLYGKKDIRVKETDIPEIKKDEILLKIKSVALCGSDLRMFNYGHSAVPLIPGHEISGIIEKVGEDIGFYKKSMKITLAPNIGCGICDACVSGNTHLCPEYKAFGINIDGGFAEYMVIPSKAILQGNIAVLDDKTDFDKATLAEPLSCAYNGFEKYKPQIGDNALIIGAGPIGLLHAKLCRLAGCSKIFMQDLSEDRLRQCKEIDSEIITTDKDPSDIIYDLTSGKGADVCVVACPAPSAQSTALKLMAQGGRLCFFGGIPKEKQPVPLDTNIIHYKEISVSGSTRSSVSQFRKALAFIEEGLIKVDDLITDKYGIDEINTAFENMNNAKGIKHIINFH